MTQGRTFCVLQQRYYFDTLKFKAFQKRYQFYLSEGEHTFLPLQGGWGTVILFINTNKLSNTYPWTPDRVN